MTTVYRNPAQTSDSAVHETRILPKAKPMLDVISVNGVQIPEADIFAEAQNHPADKPGDALMAAARALVVRELLLQEARRLAIAGAPEATDAGQRETPDDAAIRALIEHEVSVPLASEAECRRYYDNNRPRFRSDPIYEVRHILMPALVDDEGARERARAESGMLIAHLRQHPADFAAMARRHSACPSKEQGGNLGQVAKGATVPEFETALQVMAEGELRPQPVETRFGFHVVVLDRKVAGSQLPFDVVKDRISAWLEAASWSRAVSQYVGILAGNADILGIDLSAIHGPLVQ